MQILKISPMRKKKSRLQQEISLSKTSIPALGSADSEFSGCQASFPGLLLLLFFFFYVYRSL
jgi:hypothetical protein